MFSIDGRFVQKGQPKGVQLRTVLTAQLKIITSLRQFSMRFFRFELNIFSRFVLSFSSLCRLFLLSAKMKSHKASDVDGKKKNKIHSIQPECNGFNSRVAMNAVHIPNVFNLCALKRSLNLIVTMCHSVPLRHILTLFARLCVSLTVSQPLIQRFTHSHSHTIFLYIDRL